MVCVFWVVTSAKFWQPHQDSRLEPLPISGEDEFLGWGSNWHERQESSKRQASEFAVATDLAWLDGQQVYSGIIERPLLRSHWNPSQKKTPNMASTTPHLTQGVASLTRLLQWGTCRILKEIDQVLGAEAQICPQAVGGVDRSFQDRL